MRVGSQVAVGAVCGALILAGCGSETVEGTAGAEGSSSGSGEPVFSPCDDIPDDALRGVGVDVVTESRDILGVKQPGWNVCMWQGPAYSLSVFATVYTLDDVRSNKNNHEFTAVNLNGREATSYRGVADTGRRNCDVAVGSNEGAVLISISYLGNDPIVEEPCAVAIRSAVQLESYIPA
ncbi:DUF3558 domain-containing protein [Rhodococcus sp. NPDC058514]|uniref:DUF3558 domain-containing protein n=1 Tax=unclassified Rhodococcus (in: high G+C Gram-positive bacteria) TaxID=192944 RepID=UPI003646B3E2